MTTAHDYNDLNVLEARHVSHDRWRGANHETDLEDCVGNGAGVFGA